MVRVQPSAERKIIFATHTLPWQVGGKDEQLIPRQRHSALFAAISSFAKFHVGITVDQSDHHSILLNARNCYPVNITKELAYGHYEGFCKQELWNHLHSLLPDSTHNPKDFWPSYVLVNQMVADKIANLYSDGDYIWINDYHLMLVPQMLRKRLPNAEIAFFLHTPFPSSEIFRCLPRRKEVLEALLHADLIGFQTYSYSRHFISSCARLLSLDCSLKGVDYNGRHVDVGIFPIGVDVDRVQRYRKDPAVLERMASIREHYAGKKIIVGRDKLDHPGSVTHLLHAFESPPQLKCPKTELKISQLVQKIKFVLYHVNYPSKSGQFGSIEFSPVHHYHHHLEEAEYFALLSVADVGLITSLRDGMNEFVICQQETHAPLILSEFSGTAGSLSTAILVNPWDYRGVSKAIHDALTMSAEERIIKHSFLFDHVNKHTAIYWAQSFVNELDKKRAFNQLVQAKDFNATVPPRLDHDFLVEKYKKSTKRLILFDYDGTLSPICQTPEGAIPRPDMLEALKKLVNDPLNLVFVISGRDQACLDKWLGDISGLGLRFVLGFLLTDSAEHGCFIKYPNVKWENLNIEIDTAWKPVVREIFEFYTERTSGTFIETKLSSVTWHYRLADPEYGRFQMKQCRHDLTLALNTRFPVEILSGKKNLEVRPTHINKGEIVSMILERQKERYDFVICCGDDRTDEDMFRSIRNNGTLNEAITCHIGPGQIPDTEARFIVDSPLDLIELMKRMVA